jgi:phenylalanyl-tRNA synthetase beta chain
MLIDPESRALPLNNPIAAEMSVMRTSLWPGLLQALIYNVNRQQQRVRLFETGLVFYKEKDIQQIPAIGGIIYGNIYDKQWGIADRSSDIFDLKGDVEGLLASCGYQRGSIFNPSSHPALHPGQSAEIIVDDHRVGYLGILHPRIQRKLDLPHQALLFELDIRRLSRKIAPIYQKLSKFPVIRRDLALVVAEHTPVADIIECVANTVPDMLNNLELFDVYQGEGIELGKKSLALGLTFQGSSSTLREEVEAIMGKILDNLQDKFGAALRE